MRSLKLFLLVAMLFVVTIFTAFASVSLESFEGTWVGDTVTLEFATGSEIDHAAFHVWRSTSNIVPSEVNSGNATRLTASPIVGENACTAVGSDYIYEDDTVDTSAASYYYYLESIPCSGGSSSFYGSLQNDQSGLEVVNPGTPPDRKLYLPTILVQSPSPE